MKIIKYIKRYKDLRGKASILGIKVKWYWSNKYLTQKVRDKLTFSMPIWNRHFIDEVIKTYDIKTTYKEEDFGVWFYTKSQTDKSKIMTYLYPNCPVESWGGVIIDER